MSSTENPYGFRFNDQPVDYDKQPSEDDSGEQDSDNDEYGERSCPKSCCDHDCECDDCIRCADAGLIESDSIVDNQIAAAA